MEKIRNILSLLLIVMTIYVGAGVPIVHYCCEACAAIGIEAIEAGDCHQIHHHHKKGDACCNHSHQEEDECQLIIEHVDLATNSHNELEVLAPLPLLLDDTLAIIAYNLVSQLPTTYTNETDIVPPLRAYSSRYFLNLYATLTI